MCFRHKSHAVPPPNPRTGIWLVAVALAILLCASDRTDAQAPDSHDVEQLKALVTVLKADANDSRDQIEKLRTENDDLRRRVESQEAPLWSKYIETKVREYDFQAEMMDVNRHNFQHQRIASYAILALVICVVLAGLWFAHVQLMAGLAPIATAAAPQGRSGDRPPSSSVPMPLAATTLDASMGRVTVTSSVVGIVVLIISLAFLYIYTREIYTIRIVDPYRPRVDAPDQRRSPAGTGDRTATGSEETGR